MPSLQSHFSCNSACEDNQEKLLGIDDVYEQIMGSPESLFDLPPESFWVPKDSEQDWFRENANMQRTPSMKLQQGFSGDSKSSSVVSHRSFYALNAVKPPPPKTASSSLIALPKSRNPKPVTSTRLFRTLSEPVCGGSGVMRVAEPVSPKVSCTGKVRSSKKEGGRRTGLWKRLGNVLRSRFAPNRLASKRGGESRSKNRIRRQSSV